jgi:hypothetical protein
MDDKLPTGKQDDPPRFLDKLPPELVLIIAKHLREKNQSLIPLARTCRRYNDILHWDLYHYNFGVHQQVWAVENCPVVSFEHGPKAGASLYVAHILSAAAIRGRLEVVDFLFHNVQVTAADVLKAVIPGNTGYIPASHDLSTAVFGPNDPAAYPPDKASVVFAGDGRFSLISALGHAASGGHIDILEALFTVEDIHVNVTDRSGRTILFAAKNAETVRYLLGKGANCEVVDGLGRTPLLYAAFKLNHAAAEALILGGANISASDYLDKTALWPASTTFDPDMPRLLQLLVQRGADVNTVSGFRTPLQIAVQWGTHEAVMFLLGAGAHVTNAGTPDNLVLLALQREEYRTAELLLSRGTTLVIDSPETHNLWERYVEWTYRQPVYYN